MQMANTSKVSLIFKTIKKNDREDSYKLAKLLRLGELREVSIPMKYSNDLRAMTRYRKSIRGGYTDDQEQDTCNPCILWNNNR